MPTIGFEIKRKCKVCGKVFVAKTLDSHYCSPKCGKVAWKRKKDAKDKNVRLEAIARQIPDIREYISVKEAVAMFGVERNTLYRLIKSGRIPAVNIGTRLIRIKRSDMENLFLTRPESIAEKRMIHVLHEKGKYVRNNMYLCNCILYAFSINYSINS